MDRGEGQGGRGGPTDGWMERWKEGGRGEWMRGRMVDGGEEGGMDGRMDGEG